MIVEARGVTKRFGERVAVDDLDLDVPAGICFGLLGPNGAGKTTALRMIYGVTRPTAGRIRVFGIDIAEDARAVRARLGVTLQENVFIDVLSPIMNLRVFGRYHLMREPDLGKRIEELIDFLELRSHANVPVSQLSGGFKRRLAIAQSLMNKPELLILDEPTTGLDPAVRLALWQRVRELRSSGTTVLLTTHYMDEAQRLCDRVAIIANGKVIVQGAPRDLITSHLAREAIELDCDTAEEAEMFDGLQLPTRRMRAGRRLMLYTDNGTSLVEHIRRRDPSDRRSLVVRPANLEDVFLTLTGTTLVGGA
jgi:lipooligosaccharide transport system ATP-binding protein